MVLLFIVIAYIILPIAGFVLLVKGFSFLFSYSIKTLFSSEPTYKLNNSKKKHEISVENQEALQ